MMMLIHDDDDDDDDDDFSFNIPYTPHVEIL